LLVCEATEKPGRREVYPIVKWNVRCIAAAETFREGKTCAEAEPYVGCRPESDGCGFPGEGSELTRIPGVRPEVFDRRHGEAAAIMRSAERGRGGNDG
jgi:hypothetical protein